MLVPKFHGMVKAGKLYNDNIDRYNKYLRTLEGKRIEFTVKEIKHPKTPNQNNYFHGVVLPLFADASGIDVNYEPEYNQFREDVKESFGIMIKAKSLKTGEERLVPKSIGDYTKEDYKILIDNCIRYCAENLNFVMPEPEKVDIDNV